MKRLIVSAALALAASTSFADLVATHGQNELRLLQEPCTHEGILAKINEQYRAQFKRATAYIAGETMAACWIDSGEGSYLVAFADGDVMVYSITAFIEQPGV